MKWPLIADYRFKNDLLWKFNLKYMDAPRANYVDFGGSTISEATVADGYTLANGDVYEGLAEGRRTWLHVGKVKNFLVTSGTKQTLRHPRPSTGS